MPKNDETVSGEEPGEVKRDSVYDFLYHDARRVASFLAQFDPSGHLTGVKQTESAGEQESEEGSAQATANAVVARATGGFTNKRGTSAAEGSERMYDPLWANARTFLDYMTERDMLASDLRSARIGQFVIASGSLMIMDLSRMKLAWEIPSIKKLVRDGAKQGPVAGNREQRRSQKQPTVNEVDVLFELLKLFPHSIQARLLAPQDSIWCSLDENSMVSNASDLMIKHGTLIGGTWNIVGVLDAFPYDPDYLTEDGEPLANVLATLATTPIGQMTVQLAPIAQSLLGRPPLAYGVTPLMIFREIGA